MDFDFAEPLLIPAETRRTSARRVAAACAEFPVGIEEECFVVDAGTFAAATETPEALFKPSHRSDEAVMVREFLQCQLEVATRPHKDLAAAEDELAELRAAAGERAGKYGLAILACGTHPTGRWRESVQTPKPRYDRVMDDLQMIGQRNMLCGMHVHVQLPDASRRVEVMTRLIPYIPLLLALSTSSPFWQGRNTGLKGYRLAAYDELPRTGLPELFKGNEDYDAYVDALVRSGIIPDSSHLWWAIRVSRTYPTLELRAPDCCTRLADALAIAALYRSLVRHLCRVRAAELDVVARSLAVENKWRAQRYGLTGTFATASGAISVAEFLEEVLMQVSEDAEALGCMEQIGRCRHIVSAGTSADTQRAIFEACEDEAEGFDRVARWIAATTLVR